MLRIDHVLLAVADLDGAAAEVEARHGLASVTGGRHAGHGTANRIVPLGGDAYLELIGVVDADEAATSVLGRRVAAAAGSFLGWCVATGDVEAIGARLGRRVLPMERPNVRGDRLAWRLAGLEDTVDGPSLPFFISWDNDPALHPSREPAAHRVEPRGIARLAVAGDPATVEARLGSAHGLPIDVIDEAPRGVRAVVVATAAGDVTIEAGPADRQRGL